MASNESKCRDCGEILVWDDKNLTQNGKKFPVEKNGNRHNCPFSKFNKNQDKTLGDKTPMEALSAHEREIKELKKKVADLEIEFRWGNQKTGTVEEPKKHVWEKAEPQPSENAEEDPLEKYRV